MNKGFSYLAMLMLVAGCANVRHVAIPKVNDIGPHVVTQNKCRLAGYKVGQRDIQFGDIKDSLERNYPNVFADSGIPFTIQETENVNFSTKYGWTFLFPSPAICHLRSCAITIRQTRMGFADFGGLEHVAETLTG